MRCLLDSVEILHSHDQGVFHERLFEATRLVFGETYHGLELVGRDGSHSKVSDMPWPAARRAELLRRSGEVAPVEHPIFALMARGEQRPVRLSDLMSQNRLRRTNLYNDLFKPVDVRYQIVIPLISRDSVGGLAIHRGGMDFSDEELTFAEHFARHVRLSYETAKRLESASIVASPATAKNGTALDPRSAICERLSAAKRAWSLTERQTAVLALVAAGESNKSIASTLGCAEVTIESHVTALLRKSGSDGRTRLVTRFWTC